MVRALAGGATVDPHGSVYLSWAGYTQRDGATGRVNLYISKSSDGGESWTTRLMDASGAPPDCGAYRCEWGYLGAQITMTSDAAGTLYALWNSGAADKEPRAHLFLLPRPQPARLGRQDWNISTAASSVEHAFPALPAGAAGDVRIA